MGLIFNGNGDVIKAVDGSLTVEGIDLGGSTNIEAGIGTFSGNLNVGGVLTYEDVKNVDSVGIVTAREGIFLPDNKKATFGAAAGGYLEVYNSGSDSFIKSHTDDLWIYGHDNIFLAGTSSNHKYLRTVDSGGVFLYHNNSVKFETTSSGVTVTGTVAATSYTGDGSNLTSLPAQATIANNADNRVITGGSGVNLNGESTLTYDGSTLAVTGDVTMTNTSSNPQLALISANNGISEIQFGDGADAVRGNILYRAGSAGDALCFNGYNNTERMRIDSSGDLRIGNTTQTFLDAARNLVVGGGSGSEGITIYSGSSDGGFIAFADGTSDPAYRMGQIIYDHSANEMLFRTNGNNNRLVITSAGKILVGTTTEGSSGVDNLILYRNGNGGITIRNNANQNGNLFFSRGTSGTDEYKGYIQYQHAQDRMVFGTSNTERLRITSAGLVKILGDGGNDGFYLSNAYGQAGIFGGMYYNGSAWVRAAAGTRKGAGMYVNTGGHIAFLKAAESSGTSATVTESLRITSTGQLLVGTSSSSDQFHFLKSHNSHTRLVVQNNWGSNATAQLKLISPTDEFQLVKYASGPAHISLSNSSDIKFYIGGTERMRIDSNGYTHQDQMPVFHAQSSPSRDSSGFVHSFGSVHTNIGSHYNNGSGKFTAPVNGFYFFSFSVWCNDSNVNDSTGSLAVVTIRNSSDTYQRDAAAFNVMPGDGASYSLSASGSGVVYMAANDHARLSTQFSLRGSQPRNMFSGFLVHAT